MKTLLVLLILTLSACSTLDRLQEKGSEKVAQSIIAYCLSTDAFTRSELRDQVNAKLEGTASIEINCKR